MDTDSKFPICFIPPARNYRCSFYSECLDKHVVRESESTAFDCIGCTYWKDCQDIDPAEGYRAAALLAEIFGPAKVGRAARDMLGRQAPAELEIGRWIQPLCEEAA